MMEEKSGLEKLNRALENMSIAVFRLSISTSDLEIQTRMFSDEINARKMRYHPFIYWMYEIGILK
jgi:hypothetical protein